MICELMVNNMPVKAFYDDEDVKTIFLPLLSHLTKLQEACGRRILVMLAAPPGAGKTTLLNFLHRLSQESEGIREITPIGMDGFHRYQDYLLSHTMMRDGKEIVMASVKGCPETFDAESLLSYASRIKSGEVFGWPEYDRMLENPVEDKVTVEGDIILLEGNYLLLRDPIWCELKELADYTIKITADEKMLKKRLVDRKSRSGSATTYEEAERFVEYSDLVNVRTTLERSMDADLTLQLSENGRYTKI